MQVRNPVMRRPHRLERILEQTRQAEATQALQQKSANQETYPGPRMKWFRDDMGRLRTEAIFPRLYLLVYPRALCTQKNRTAPYFAAIFTKPLDEEFPTEEAAMEAAESKLLELFHKAQALLPQKPKPKIRDRE